MRLVTGLPKTVDRSVLGQLSRIVVQTTTVGLARTRELDSRRPRGTISVPGEFRRYRDLLDRVLAERRASSQPALLLLSEELPPNNTTPTSVP